MIIEVNSTSTKVEGDITYILYDDQKRELARKGLWPAEFALTTAAASASAPTQARDADDSDNEDDLMENPNRPYFSDSDDDDDEEEGEEDEADGVQASE